MVYVQHQRFAAQWLCAVSACGGVRYHWLTRSQVCEFGKKQGFYRKKRWLR